MDKYIINNIFILYSHFLNNPEFVFTYIRDNIVILKKMTTNINNENKTDIYNILTAKYYGFNFITVKIFNIWNPHVNFKSIILDCKNNRNENTNLLFTINKQVRNINEEEEIDDGDIIMRDTYYLDYYKLLDVTIYKILAEYIKSIDNYNGECLIWDNDGRLISHQHYY